MDNSQKVNAVINLFQDIVTRFEDHPRDYSGKTLNRKTLNSVLNGSFHTEYNTGTGRVSVSAEATGRFGRETKEGEAPMVFRVNWPGCGSHTKEVARQFGEALVEVSRHLEECEKLVKDSGLTPEDFELARETVDEISKKVRANIQLGLPEGDRPDPDLVVYGVFYELRN